MASTTAHSSARTDPVGFRRRAPPEQPHKPHRQSWSEHEPVQAFPAQASAGTGGDGRRQPEQLREVVNLDRSV